MAIEHLDDLERLERLRADGALSDGEFQREKATLLAPTVSTVRPRWKVVFAICVAAFVLFAVMIAIIWREPQRDMTNDSSGNAVSLSPNVVDAPQALPSPAASPAEASMMPSATDEADYNEAVQSVDKDYPTIPPEIRRVLGQELGADTLCRGGSDPDKWCPVRDRLSDKLTAIGMCFGRPTDQSAADSDWHKCDDRDQVVSPGNAQ